jgi:hypothetical protein
MHLGGPLLDCGKCTCSQDFALQLYSTISEKLNKSQEIDAIGEFQRISVVVLAISIVFGRPPHTALEAYAECERA